MPSSVANQDRQIGIDGVADDPDRPTVVNYRAISPAYLATMQIPLIAGRGFTAADAHDVAPVSIVSESFARTYLAGGSPLGRRVRIGASGDTWTTVVGVSADTVDDWFNSRREPTLFVPFAQFPSEGMTLVARTSGDAAQLADGLRRALADVDPHQPAFEAMTVREVVRTRTTGLRFIAGLMAAFGGLALVLSALGIYGVMAHLVVQRRQEFSLRMALGASARDVLALTLGQGARLTAMGIAVGLVAAAGLARLIEGALFGIVALEWTLFASTTVALGLVALLAAVVPAARAMRLDPAVVLRE
jgi:putative ABC transport system permease protein